MKLTISNFGPVKGTQDYQLDFKKDFTLVTGANGLGKTYLGYLVYGLIKRINLQPLPPRLFKELTENSKSIDLNFDRIKEYFETLIKAYKDDIHIYMGIDRQSAEMIFKDLNVGVLNLDAKYRDFFENSYEKTLVLQQTITFSLKKEANSSILNFMFNQQEAWDSNLSLPVVDALICFIVCKNILVNGEIGNVHYFPVERNSLYTFSRELLLNRSQIIEETLAARRKVNRYPEAIEDALKDALDLNQTTKNESDKIFIDLAAQIERDVLQGEILVSSDGEVQFVPVHSQENRVPAHLGASFIKTISSLVFFLKHKAVKGDLIMIDEPEMNLHPNLQVLFARVLVRISNAGIKVWVSTHSDYIISELNNLCLLGTLKNKGVNDAAERLGYASDDFLDRDKMQALYLSVNNETNRVDVENLEIRDNGVDIKSIDQCLSDLNARTNELSELYENLD